MSAEDWTMRPNLANVATILAANDTSGQKNMPIVALLIN
jgi:hypothetical protein